MALTRLQPVYAANGFIVVVKTKSDPKSNDYQFLDDKCVRREKSGSSESLPAFIVVLTEEEQFVGLFKRLESVENGHCINDCDKEQAFCWMKVY